MVSPHLILPVTTRIIFKEVCKQTTFRNVKRDDACRETKPKKTGLSLEIWPYSHAWILMCQTSPIDTYHLMSKQEILPVEPLIQCEAGRAKTIQRQSLYSPRTPKWPRRQCFPRLRLGEHWGSRGNKTHCFPWGQSLMLIVYSIPVLTVVDVKG